MDTTNTSSREIDSRIEETFCGVPSTPNLLDNGFEWITNLQRRGYVDASNNTLTQRGKKLFFDPSSKRDWVTKEEDGTISAHADFKVAQSIVSNRTVGHPDQLLVNHLCLNLTLLSCFKENQKKGTGTNQYKSKLEDAQTELKQAYQDWHDHVHDNGKATRNPTWFQNDKPVTVRVATAAHKLSCLVMDPDDDVYQGQPPGPPFPDLTVLSGEWDPTSATDPFRTNFLKSSKIPSEAAESHGQHHHSLPNRYTQSTVSHKPPGSGSVGVLGGMTVPSGDGPSADVGQKRFPDKTKKGGNSGTDDWKNKIKKSISRMAE